MKINITYSNSVEPPYDDTIHFSVTIYGKECCQSRYFDKKLSDYLKNVLSKWRGELYKKEKQKKLLRECQLILSKKYK